MRTNDDTARRILRASALALPLCLAGPTRAAPRPVQDFGQENIQPGSYAWTGTRRTGAGSITRAPRLASVRISQGDSSRVVRPDPRETADGLLTELAQLRARVAIDGDLAGSERALRELRARASDAEGYAGQADVLVQIALARRELHLLRGERAAAEASAAALLPGAADVAAFPELVLEPAPDPLIALVRRAAADPRLAPPAPAGAAQSADEAERIAATVRESFGLGTAAPVVRGIGPPAARTLERMVREDPEALPGDLARDPLVYLLELAERRGAALIAELLPEAGFFFKKRALRAMLAEEVLSDEGTWRLVDSHEVQLLEPDWVPIVQGLLRDPAVRTEALPLVRAVARFDAVPAELAATLVESLAGADLDYLNGALEAISFHQSRPSLEPVWGALLEHPEARVRRVAADALAEHPSSPVLVAAAGHPDPVVRKASAAYLTPAHHGRLVFSTRGDGPFASSSSERREAPIGAPERAALTRLLGDTEDEVRLAAVGALASLDIEPLPWSVYEALAGDPDARVRRAVVQIAHDLAQEERDRLFAILAEDPDEGVLVELDVALQSALDPAIQSGSRSPDSLIRVALRRLQHPTQPLGARLDRRRADRLRAGVVVGATDLETVARVLLDGPEEYRTALVNNARWERHGELSADTLAEAMQLAEVVSPHELSELIKELIAADRVQVRAMRKVARNPKSSPWLRSWAAVILSRAGLGEARETIELVARDPVWAEPRVPNAWDQLHKHAPYDELHDVLLEWLADPTIQDAVLEDVTHWVMRRDDPKNARLARVVLERWLGSGAPATVERALDYLHVDEGTMHLVLAAAADNGVADGAIRVMGRERRAEFLAPLAATLRGETEPSRNDVDLRVLAARALTAYMNDDAAEILLSVAGSTDSTNLREACFQGLEAIRRFQEESARWTRRRAGEAARAEAIGRLVEQLDSDRGEVRSAAALGLGTLGAIEEIPRLIELLGDAEPEVVAAAREALEKLNRED